MVTVFGEVEPAYTSDVMDFMTFQQERCPTSGRLHFQTYVIFKTRQRLSGVKRCMGSTVHAETAKCDVDVCVAYCSKVETRVAEPKSFGEKPATVVLVSILEDLKKRKISEVLESNPKLWRSVKQMKDVQNLYSVPRNFMTMGVLLTGRTGTGKSKIMMLISQFVGESCWVNSDLRWFDPYQGERMIVIDEVRDLKISMMLRLVDRYPLKLEVKGGFVEMTATMVMMSSNLSWNQLSCSLDIRTIEALKRRISIYEVY